MNYLKIYDSLITKAKNRNIILGEYMENHHIIPKCMGGNNTKENLVKLTSREHFIAHALLYYHYKTTKLIYAWRCMFRKGDNQERKFTSKQYSIVKNILVEKLKIEMNGPGNNFYGKRHTEETKLILSKIMKTKNIKISPETMVKIIEKAKRPKSIEHRKKIGRKGFIMLKNIETGKTIRILREDKLKYDETIWMNPYKILRMKLKEKL